MTLLYVLDEDSAIDDDGVRWTQEPGGAWRPVAESQRQADLRLVWSVNDRPGRKGAPRRLPRRSDGPRLASA